MHFQAIDIDNDHFWPLLHNIEECNATHSRVSVLSMRLAKWAIVANIDIDSDKASGSHFKSLF